MANKIYFSSENGSKEINAEDVKGLTVVFEMGDNNNVTIGEGCNLNGLRIIISGNYNLVTIGKKVTATNCVVMLNGDFSYRKVSVGSFTYIGGALIQVLYDYSAVKIGNDCMLSDGINITTNYGIKIFDLKTEENLSNHSDVIIGDHVWIGRNAFVGADTIIADDCIVGTKSFITGHYLKSNCSIAGNPARIVKKNINFIKCEMKNFDLNIKNLKE